MVTFSAAACGAAGKDIVFLQGRAVDRSNGVSDVSVSIPDLMEDGSSIRLSSFVLRQERPDRTCDLLWLECNLERAILRQAGYKMQRAVSPRGRQRGSRYKRGARRQPQLDRQ